MKNNKGFTLLELLVAATIIGILAVFATTSYKNSAAEARVAAAKARTKALANAVARMRIEYPSFKTVSGRMTDVSYTGTQTCSSSSLSGLVSCGYLGNSGWSNDTYMTYWVCDGKTDGCTLSPVSDPLACMLSTGDAKLSDRYRSGYIFCVNDMTDDETFAGS